MAATEHVPIVDDYEKTNEEPQTLTSLKEAEGESVTPPFAEERAKILKLLSDMFDITR